MKNINTNPVKGTRDFYGADYSNREFVIKTCEKKFKLFGFLPLLTPVFEHIDILDKNYGEEGAMLLYRVLNSGDPFSNVDFSKPIQPQVVEKGLRYDLTIPMMRYVANNFNTIKFPWKRSQIQPVWRADRPQKGRFREFIQCDVDIVGSKSFFSEVELIVLTYSIMQDLNLNDFTLHLNHIGIFKELLKTTQDLHNFIQIFTAIDKYDKVGREKVLEDLAKVNCTQKTIDLVNQLIQLRKSTNNEVISFLKTQIPPNFHSGIEEIEKIINSCLLMNVNEAFITVNPLLARGLSYYTKTVFEVKCNKNSIGSIVGGGRYDDMLVNSFSLKHSSNFDDTAVGVSFGIDRICAYLSEHNLQPLSENLYTEYLIVSLDSDVWPSSLKILSSLRQHNISSEMFYDVGKLKSAFDFATKKNIDKVILVGKNEINDGNIIVRDLNTSTQQILPITSLILKNS